MKRESKLTKGSSTLQTNPGHEMSEQFPDFTSCLDDISLTLIMLDPNNLISLGELLGKLEDLKSAFAPIGSAESDLILKGLNKILEGVILEEIKNKPLALDSIEQGIKLLQEIERSFSRQRELDENLKKDISVFLSALQNELNIELNACLPTSANDTADQENAGLQSKFRDQAPANIKKTAELNFNQDKEIFYNFFAESTEYIEESEVKIVDLEQDPRDKEIINLLFRSFHTIKGVSGFLNITPIHNLTHEMENLLNETRNEQLAVTPPVIDLLLDSIDLLKKMINDLKASLDSGQAWETEYYLSEFLDRVKAVQQGEAQPNPDTKSINTGLKLGEILIEQGLITENELEKALQELEEGRFRKLGEFLLENGLISNDDLEAALYTQQENKHKKLGEILIETGQTSSMDISAALAQQEKTRDRKLGAVLINTGKADARQVTSALRMQNKTMVNKVEKIGHAVKVDTSKLDNVVDMVGELVIAQSLVNQNQVITSLKDPKLSQDLNSLSRLTSELQRTAMSLRMVPVKQTFQRMIRLVRDLSHKSGKKIALRISGEETEIDRNMVEAIYDPLVHMIRNAVDHGIETPDVRSKKGKLPEGRIYLRAYHQGGNVVIEIQDDGQGLDKEKILSKAISRGIVKQGENLSETAVYNLIFLPGFSTSERVTEISGRGVGMDVVKKAINKLRGKIDITSKPGFGSTICLRMPLTLAIIDGMIVRIGQNRYILPTTAIRESFRPLPSNYYTFKGRGEMIKVRESLLPLIRLYQVLEIEPSNTDPTKSLVVVLENEGQCCCVMVDEFISKQEVVIKSLGESLKKIKTIAGGSILGDGRVGLILDVSVLFEKGRPTANSERMMIT